MKLLVSDNSNYSANIDIISETAKKMARIFVLAILFQGGNDDAYLE